jgi:NDP-sugar pyrophosphorylase family protein
MLNCPVIVLCGGLGSRLRSAVSDRPKSLASVGEDSFLALQLRLLRARGARHFVLCVGHLAEQIEAAFGDGSALGVRIDYSHDGETLLGTGGALKRAERFFAPNAIVVNGDTYIDVNLVDLAELHTANAATATLTLARMPDASRYGTVAFAGSRVTAFREKDSHAGAAWVNAGVYTIHRDLLASVPANTAVSLERDVLPAALHTGKRVCAFPQTSAFRDIGTPEDYREFVCEVSREREVAYAA